MLLLCLSELEHLYLYNGGPTYLMISMLFLLMVASYKQALSYI